MDIKYLKSLIKLITDTDITEFELETDGQKIRFQRGAKAEPMNYIVSRPEIMDHKMSSPAPLQTSESVVALPITVSASDKTQNVCSPIVGTMYRSPAPDAPPYVEVGQVVEKGQVLCIVEAMKLMNEIEAEFRCKIIRIIKENAQPVEYGEPLFLVEPL